MHADHKWLWSISPSCGDGKVMFKLRNVVDSPRGVLPLLASEGRNLCTNHAVVNEVQPENRHARIVAATLKIAIDENRGEILPCTSDKVHRKKSDVADDINVA